MESCIINFKQNCNNSNRSFNLSSHQRKKLWFYTLDYANGKRSKKAASLNSINKGHRRKSINDIDEAYSEYLIKDSLKKKSKCLQRSVTFCNATGSKNDEEKKVTFQDRAIRKNKKVTSCLKNSQRNLFRRSIDLIIKQKYPKKEDHRHVKPMYHHRDTIDAYSTSLNNANQFSENHRTVLKDESDLKKEAISGLNIGKYRQKETTKNYNKNERFDNFFNYLEKQDTFNEKSKHSMIKEYVNNIKCIWGKEDELVKGTRTSKQNNMKKLYEFKENCSSKILKYDKDQVKVSPVPNIHGVDLKKQDLTYDDQYLYGSIRDDISTTPESINVPQTKFMSPLFPKMNQEEINPKSSTTEPLKKSLKSLSVHKLFSDVKNILPFQTKHNSKKSDSKFKKLSKKQMKKQDLKYSNVKEFEDEFYNTSKYILRDEKQSQRTIRNMIRSGYDSIKSERVYGIDEVDMNQSIDIDEYEPIEIAEKYVLTEFLIDDIDCEDIKSVHSVNEKGEDIITFKTAEDAIPIKTDVIHEHKSNQTSNIDKSSIVSIQNNGLLYRSEIMNSGHDLQSIVTSMTPDEQIEVITMKIFDDLVSENKISVNKLTEVNENLEKLHVKKSEHCNNKSQYVRFVVTEQVTNIANENEMIVSFKENSKYLKNEVESKIEKKYLSKCDITSMSDTMKMDMNRKTSPISSQKSNRSKEKMKNQEYKEIPILKEDKGSSEDIREPLTSSLVNHNRVQSELFMKERAVYNNELIEAVSRNTTNKPTNSDKISRCTPIANKSDMEKLDFFALKSKVPSEKSSFDNNTIAVDIPRKIEKNVILPPQVDVLLEDLFLSCEPDQMTKTLHIQPDVTWKGSSQKLNTYLLTTNRNHKSGSFMSKTTVPSQYHGLGRRTGNLYTGDSNSINHIRPLPVNPNLYRCNEMLLHSKKVSRPISTPGNTKCSMKPNVKFSKNTNKNSFWCMPYNNQAKSFEKEKQLLTFSYKSTCADCKGKSFQNFQLMPQSPQHDYFQTSDNSMKTLYGQYHFDNRYNFDGVDSIDLSQSDLYNKTYNKSCMNISTLKHQRIDDQKYIVIEKETGRLKQNSFKKPSKHEEFEIQNLTDKSNREIDNSSVYLVMEKHDKMVNANHDTSEKKDTQKTDDNKVIVSVKKNSIVETDFIQKINDMVEDNKKSSEICSVPKFNYNPIVFGPETRLSFDSYFEEKSEIYDINKEIPKDHAHSTINDPPLSYRGQHDLKLITEILNSNIYGLPETPKESLSLSTEFSKSTKLDFEYNGTVDMDNVDFDCGSSNPLSITSGKNGYERNSKIVKIDQRKLQDVHNLDQDRFITKENVTMASGDLTNDENARYLPLTLEPKYREGWTKILDSDTNDINDHSVNVDNDLFDSGCELQYLRENEMSQNYIDKSLFNENQSKRSNRTDFDSNNKIQELLETSTEINTEHKILKESSRALKLKETDTIDPEDLLVSTFEPPTVGQQKVIEKVSCENIETLASINKNDQTLSKKELSKSSLSVDVKGCTQTDEITKITDIQKQLLKKRYSFTFESNRTSEREKVTEVTSYLAPVEAIFIELLKHLFVEFVDALLSCYNIRLKTTIDRKFENTSNDDCTFISDTQKQSELVTVAVSANLCCYFCQCQIPQQDYEEHIKLCTETQKNLIVQTKTNPGKIEQTAKDKVRSTRPGTICFLCGCYFTKHSILIHEVACRKKWIRRNEQLPKGQRKPIPIKPFISDEMIRENYEREQHLGNNKFKLKDAVNKLIYEASLRNHIDFET